LKEAKASLENSDTSGKGENMFKDEDDTKKPNKAHDMVQVKSILKKIRKNHKHSEIKDDDKVDFKISSQVSQLSNAAEKASIDKKTKFALNQVDSESSEDMDNINAVKSAKDIKRVTNLQNLM